MFISYIDDEIRECCFLLKPDSVNSRFTTDEIKDIRALLADIRAAPDLQSLPFRYEIDRASQRVIFDYKNFIIIAEIISSYRDPLDHQIERVKIVQIVNKITQNLDLNKTNLMK